MVEIKSLVSPVASFSMKSRSYLSMNHILSAVSFAQKADDIERTYSRHKDESYKISYDHRGYVIATIMLSISFLEANINEFCADSEENRTDNNKTVFNKRDLIGRLWTEGIPRTAKYKIIEKYNFVLSVYERDTFKIGCKPGQDVLLLTKLRNALIHYEPETVLCDATPSSNPGDKHSFEKMFKGKFEINPIAGRGDAFYPNKLLGSSCAKWAAKSAISFADSFFDKIEIPRPYEHIRDDIII